MRLRLSAADVTAALRVGALIVVLGFVRMAVAAEPGGAAVGQWLIQDRTGVIDIYRCGAGICGKIVGMSDINDAQGRASLDNQGRAKCGLVILQATVRADNGRWEGLITDPTNGTRWNCEVWTEHDGLHLRGYVLLPLLGQTQVWTPYSGKVTPDCRMVG